MLRAMVAQTANNTREKIGSKHGRFLSGSSPGITPGNHTQRPVPKSFF
jgi:hypothetical protein